MKRIVRLTESDLTRIVRRVIRESKGMINEGNGANAATNFISALSGMFDDDEAAALRAVMSLKNSADVTEFTNTIKSKKGMDFCKYLNSEMSDVDDEYDQIVNRVKSLGGPDCYSYSYAGHMKKALSNTFGSGGGGGSRRY